MLLFTVCFKYTGTTTTVTDSIFAYCVLMFLIYLLVGKIVENIGLDLVNYIFKSISIFEQNVLTVGIFKHHKDVN